MSLDVSPDGRTIVFDLLGDLYILPRTGGVAHRITTGPGFDRQPRFSPDGRRIVFVSDRDGADNVWTIDTTGTVFQSVTSERQSAFVSPGWVGPDSVIVSQGIGHGGTVGAYGSRYELRIYDIRARRSVTLASQAKTSALETDHDNCLGAAVSSDGRFVYYAHKRDEITSSPRFPQWQILRLDRTRREITTLTNVYGSAMRPVLSPNGHLLAYATRHNAATGLRVRDLTTGVERWLAYPVQRDAQESPASLDLMPGSAFTPDGRHLLTTIDGHIQSIDVRTGLQEHVLFTADVEQEIGPSLRVENRLASGPVPLGQVWAPAYSPDGSRVVFGAFGRLWIADDKGHGVRRLTTGHELEYLPTWSPDGRWIAFVTWGNGGGHVWKIQPNAGPPVRLTNDAAFYTDPVWSPDGDRVYILVGTRRDRRDPESETPLDVAWVSTAGGTVTRIVPALGARQPHFSTARDRVYLTTPNGLVSMRIDGSDRRTEVHVVSGRTEPASSANEILLSPDGQQLLIRIRKLLYIVERPKVRGSTVDVDKPIVQARLLNPLGGEFPRWVGDSGAISWALGATLFFARSNMARSYAGEIGNHSISEIKISLFHPRDSGVGFLVFRGARVVTMHGSEVIEDADLVIRDDRVVSVGRRGTIPIPVGATVLEVGGATIIPGFIDAHAHVAFYMATGVQDRASWPLLANLAYGVTTIHDPQTTTSDILTYRDLVQTGDILGPRILTTAGAVSWANGFQNYQEVDAAVRVLAEYYHTNTIKSYLVGNRETRQWVVTAARKYGVMPTTEGANEPGLDLTHVLDGFAGLEHALPIVPLGEDVIQLIARSGSWYTPTLLIAGGGPLPENYFYEREHIENNAKLRRFLPPWEIEARARRRSWFVDDEYIFRRLAASAAAILRAGGRVCLGGHGQLQGLGTHWELWALQSGGLSNHEALRLATLGTAEALGVSRDIGSLQPGKLADLLVLDRNPLENIRNTTAIRYVVKGGVVFDAATLDRITPTPKRLEPLFFWNYDPGSPHVQRRQH